MGMSSVGLVVNLMCQFVWVTRVPRYLGKHESAWSVRVFWLRLTFKSVD